MTGLCRASKVRLNNSVQDSELVQIPVGSVSGEQDEECQCCACSWQEAPPARRRADRVTGSTFLQGEALLYQRELFAPYRGITLTCARQQEAARLGSGLRSIPGARSPPERALPARRSALFRRPLSLPGDGGHPIPVRCWGGGRARAAPWAEQGRDGAGRSRPRAGRGKRWVRAPLRAYPPERWPRHRLEPQPLPFAPALPLSLPRPHLFSKTAGAATAPLHSFRCRRRSGAGGPKRRHGPGREQPHILPAAPLPWPVWRPSTDDAAGRPTAGRLGSRPGGREAAGGPRRPPGAPGASGEAAGAGAGRPGHAAAAGGGRRTAAPVRAQQGAPPGGHPLRAEGAAGKGRHRTGRPLPRCPAPLSPAAAASAGGQERPWAVRHPAPPREPPGRAGTQGGQGAAAAAPALLPPRRSRFPRGQGRAAGPAVVGASPATAAIMGGRCRGSGGARPGGPERAVPVAGSVLAGALARSC